MWVVRVSILEVTVCELAVVNSGRLVYFTDIYVVYIRRLKSSGMLRCMVR
jgi:hypothetical protein